MNAYDSICRKKLAPALKTGALKKHRRTGLHCAAPARIFPSQEINLGSERVVAE